MPVRISPLVPRREKGSQGRRPPRWPDLNFTEIARNIGISSTFLGRIMNGRLRPSIPTAQKLAAYLKVSMEEIANLYDESGEKFSYGRTTGTGSNIAEAHEEKKSDVKSQQRAGRRAEGKPKALVKPRTQNRKAPAVGNKTKSGKPKRKT